MDCLDDLRQRAMEARRKYLRPPQEINQLSPVDITWIDVGQFGMHYVTNVIDYVRRFPLASRLSPRKTAEDAVSALEDAVGEAKRLRGDLPEEVILVSDNGSQFTSNRFRKWIRDSEVGFRHLRGRPHHPQTTGMVERYHQSMKYEEVWLNDYRIPSKPGSKSIGIGNAMRTNVPIRPRLRDASRTVHNRENG